MSDLISRQWLMECVNEGWIKFDTEKDENRFIHLVRDMAPSAHPEQPSREYVGQLKWERDLAIQQLKDLGYGLGEKPRTQPEIIRCKDCIYYDPKHIENNGIRYEYKDMPKEAFDELDTGLVYIEYGINVGGRCCIDYNVGYSEDKRVFVPETNYCGRAERRTDESNV